MSLFLPFPLSGASACREVGAVLLGLVALVLLAGCATPVAPTGGPVDDVPPRIRIAEPADQTVNFAGDRLTLVFTEYVDQASFQQAFSITPAFDTPPDIDWRGKRVRITFPEALRDSTTYIFSLDTELRDLNRIALDRPITLAVSTGPRIDRGRIAGTVRNPAANRPVAQIDLFAYALDDTSSTPGDSLEVDPFERAPDYRTQTGDDGRFAFAYLADRPFFVLAVEDRNRNRRLDPGEGFAVPPRPAIRAVADPEPDTLAAPADSIGIGIDSLAVVLDTLAAPPDTLAAPPDTLAAPPDTLAAPPDTLAAPPDTLAAPLVVPDSAGAVSPSSPEAGIWYLTRRDTAAPELQRLRTLSGRRLQLRFTEPVELATADPGAWTVEDSLSGQPVPVRAAYRRPAEPPAVYVVTDSLPPVPHRLRTTAVRDTAGNAFPAAWQVFTPAVRADTFRVRFSGFRPDPAFARVDTVVVLLPGEAPGAAFTQYVPETRLRQGITLADTAGAAVAFRIETDDGVTYRLRPEEPPTSGRVLRLTIDGRLVGRDTLYTQAYRVLADDERGEVAGYVRASAGPVLVELYRQADRPPPVLVATLPPDSTGRFLFRDVPAGVYRVRAFIDRDGSAAWSGGSVRPYAPAEPVVWSRDSVEARARWEIPFPDTLRLDAVSVLPVQP